MGRFDVVGFGTDSEDGLDPCCYRLNPEDPRPAIFQPGVGDFLRCSVLDRPWHDIRLLPDGPCAVPLPSPRPKYDDFVPTTCAAS